jgi:hypothetical protein
MLASSVSRAALLFAALVCSSPFLGACEKPAPVVPKEAEPPPPPPKPKPKCEAMIEGCKATNKTRARVEGTDFVFTPPTNWVYAQEAELTRARPKEGGAILGLASFEDGDAKTRDAAFVKLAEVLEIKLPEQRLGKKKYAPTWNKPDDSKKPGQVDLKFWQAVDAKHGEEKGYLLVLLAPVQGGRSVLGVAFSPDGDEKSIELIPAALETLNVGGDQ